MWQKFTRKGKNKIKLHKITKLLSEINNPIIDKAVKLKQNVLVSNVIYTLRNELNHTC